MLERVKKRLLAAKKIKKWASLPADARIAMQAESPTEEDYLTIEEQLTDWSQEERFQLHQYQKLLDNVSNKLYWYVACIVTEHRQIADQFDELIYKWRKCNAFVEMCNSLAAHYKLGYAPNYEKDVRGLIGDFVPVKVFKNGKIKIDTREIAKQVKELTNQIKDILLIHLSLSLAIANRLIELGIAKLVGEDFIELIGELGSQVVNEQDIYEEFNSDSERIIDETDLPLFSQICTPQDLKAYKEKSEHILNSFGIHL